jgi:integrase
MVFACVVADSKEPAMIKVKLTKWKGPKFDWEVSVRVQQPNGVWLRKRIGMEGTAKQAEKEAHRLGAEMLQDAVRKELEPPEEKRRRKMPTLAEFAPTFKSQDLQANHLKPTTIDTYDYRIRIYLLPKLGKKRLDEIDLPAIQLLKSELGALQDHTRNDILGVLSKMLNVAVDWGVLDKVPARFTQFKVKAPKVKRADFYDFAQYEALRAAAKKADPHLYAMVLLGGDAGLRRGEIAAVEWSDVNLDLKLLTVRRSVYKGQVTLPKGGRERTLNMTTRLTEALRAIKQDEHQRVVLNAEKKPITESEINEVMFPLTRAAGLTPSRRVHILRHTFCAHLAIRGAPPRAIQELAGHTEPSTTERYLHLTPSARSNAIKLLEEPVPT